MSRRRPRSRSGRPPVDLLEVLAREPDGGGTRDVGNDQDVAILDSLRDFGRLPPEAQAAVRSRVGEDGSWQLVGWAERACTWAVRTRDRDVLAAAAAAASLHDPERIDSRDALLVLDLVSGASTLAGARTDSVLERARTMTDVTGGSWLRDHLRTRAPLPATHREVGFGSHLGFERVEVTGDLYTSTRQLLDDLAGAGHDRWARELDAVLRAGATGSEVVMGLRWVLSRLAASGDVDDTAITARVRGLVAEADRALGS